MENQPLLAEWNSQLYVLYAVVFDEIVYDNGNRDHVIHKLLLLDPRFTNTRREVIFDREKSDWKQVQGILRLRVSGQRQ